MANHTRNNPPAWWRAPLAALPLALAACGGEVPPEAPAPLADAADAEAPLSAETRQGPVTATVSLSPASPRLGDSLALTLTVEAEQGVAVEMPAFGDALGRFAIVDFAPGRETTERGTRLWQRYTLQVSASGRQRIPRLRVTFTDERGTAAGQGGPPRELMTDELGFKVESMLPEGAAAAALRPARDPLPELAGSWLARYWPWLAALVTIAAATGFGVVFWHRRRAFRARLTAYDRAARRLQRLRRAGLPAASGLDAWYVELSDIVRRYIEERFALRAPELTTEEFLSEAGRSALSKPHRGLLSAFLEICDRVKFARYHPGQEESRQALDVAQRFLDETRLNEQTPAPLEATAGEPAAARQPRQSREAA